MDLQVAALDESKASHITVSDAVFGCDYKEPLIHQVLVAYQAGMRQGTRAQKTRREVRGGGIKPWRQKGTGRARAGSIRSPIWVGGGRAFPAKPRDFSKKVNRKMYRQALASILSELIRQKRLIVINSLELKETKTKVFVQKLDHLKVSGRVLVLMDTVTPEVMLASRNLGHVYGEDIMHVNLVMLVGAEAVVLTIDAMKKLEERLA